DRAVMSGATLIDPHQHLRVVVLRGAHLPAVPGEHSRLGSPGTAKGRKLLTVDPSVTGVQGQLSPASLVRPWKISCTGSAVPSRGSTTVEIHSAPGSSGSIVPRPV